MIDPTGYDDDLTPRTDRGAGARRFFSLLRRRGWILLACVLLLPAAVYVYSARQPKSYQAQLVVQPRAATFTLSGSGATDTLYQRLNPKVDFVQAWAESSRVAALTATVRHRASSAAGLGSFADPKTGWVALTATGPSPRESLETVNAYERALDQVLVATARDARQQLLRNTAQNFSITPTVDLSASLRALRAYQLPRHLLQVVEPATGAVVVSPHPRRNATLAVILAALIGAGLIALVEYYDRRIRGPEDLAAVAGAPVLGTLPPVTFRADHADAEAAEAFGTVRDLLSQSEHSLTTLVVVSPLQGDGRTTVATGLAVAFAAAGRRVILVDANMRNGQLAARMGVPAAPGLSDALIAGDAEPELQEVEWAEGDLQLLPVGSPSASPAALLGSDRMSSLLDGLTARSDLVLIDTPALMAVSDALPILRRASGVLGVARLNETPRRAVAQMMRLAAAGGVTFLGIVATGAKTDVWTTVESPQPDALAHRKPSPVA